MRKITAIAALLALYPALAVTQEEVGAPIGRWLTEKQDTVVRIELCETGLCGYIDWVDPDEDQIDLHGVPLCGQKVFWDFTPSHSLDNFWTGGTIYRPDNGKSFSAQLRHSSPDEISVRGYVAIPVLGKTYRLNRTDGDTYPACA